MKKIIFVLPLLMAQAALAQTPVTGSPVYRQGACPIGFVYVDGQCIQAQGGGSINMQLNQAVSQLVSSARALNNASRPYRGQARVRGVVNVSISIGDLSELADRIERNAMNLQSQLNGYQNSDVSMTLSAIDRDASLAVTSAVLLASGRDDASSYAIAVVKAVGAVQFALSIPSAPVNPGPVGPTFQNVKASKCSLRFQNSWGTSFLVTAEGFDDSSAAADLYQGCARVAGAAPGSSISNAQVCQSKIAAAKCTNLVSIARAQDPVFSRFAACTLNFSNSWGTAFVQNGAGSNLVEALNNVWNSCATVSGSAPGDSIANSQVCRENFVNNKTACSLR